MPLSLFCDMVDVWIRGVLTGDDPEIKMARARYDRDTAPADATVQRDEPRPDQAGALSAQEET